MLSVEQLHSDIFKSFIMNNPDLVYLMKTSDHGVNIHKPNPYHMEGDVWTHTCLAYQALLYIPQFRELNDWAQRLVCMAVLCHDLGKPYRRFVNDSNRPRFSGHENRSVIEMMNLADYFVDVLDYTDEDIYYLMLIVASHSVYWLGKSMQEVVPQLNYSSELLDIYKVLAMADQMGQIREDVTDGKKDIYSFEFDLTLPRNDNNIIPEKTVYVTIGAPGAGKDYVLKNIINPNIKIISYDQLRVELYKEAHPGYNWNELTSTKLYEDARNWVIKTRLNLDPRMYMQIRSQYLDGHIIGVSNTNMTRKGRMRLVRKLRELCPDYSIVYVMVYAHVEDLIMRDKQREEIDKSIGSAPIYQILNNFEVPILDEGVDAIMVHYNGV